MMNVKDIILLYLPIFGIFYAIYLLIDKDLGEEYTSKIFYSSAIWHSISILGILYFLIDIFKF